jgi:hypothetical protein
MAWRSGAWAAGAFAGTVWAEPAATGAAWSADSWFQTAWRSGAWTAGAVAPQEPGAWSPESWFLTAWREGAWTAGDVVAPPVDPPVVTVGGNLTGWGYYGAEPTLDAPEAVEQASDRRRQEYADARARYEALQADAKQAKAEYEALKARQDRGAKQQAKAVAALSSELLAAELRLQNLRHLQQADEDAALLILFACADS